MLEKSTGVILMKKQVSIAIIRRLPIYYRYLEDLQNEGVEGVSSQELSNITGFTASQIRQDFNNFGGFGQQGFGYNVDTLKEKIGEILGINTKKRAVLVGAGNLGKTVARYKGFKEASLDIVGMFDRNPNNIGQKIDDKTIRDVSELDEFLQEEDLDIGIITVDADGAQDLADKYVENGVKGIWNFASVDIDTPEDVHVENVRLTESFMILSYYLNND